MIRVIRIGARLCVLLPLIVLGLLAVTLVYPFASPAARAWMNRLWSRVLLCVCGLRMVVSGAPVLSGSVLFAANHVSWIDIFVMNAVRPTAFVAKSEIRHWPVIGWLVAGAGTVFIERGNRRAMHSVGQAMRTRFEQGEAVGLFPEGTTSDGMGLLPLHTGLLEPARFSSTPIQPLALIYAHQSDRAGFPAFVGEETLVTNVCRLLGARGMNVRAHYLPVISHVAVSDGAEGSADRRVAAGQHRDARSGEPGRAEVGRAEIAAQLRAAILTGLQSPPGACD